MKVFISKVGIFLGPLLLFFAMLEAYLWYTGDIYPIEQVIALQEQDHDVRFVRGFVSQDPNVYKWQFIQKRQPEILILGSSRVMKFRDFHFSPYQEKFYNGGGMLQSAHDLIEFSNIFRDKKLSRPKLLLVGLDPWWFKKDGLRQETWLKKSELIDNAKLGITRIKVAKTLFRSGFTDIHFNLNYKKNIGALAKYSATGFRWDGSNALPDFVLWEHQRNPVFIDRTTPPIYERIINGSTNRFSVSSPDTVVFERTFTALKELQNMGIELIIFFPPFSTQSYELLEASNKHNEWWQFYSRYMVSRMKEEFPNVIPVEHAGTYKVEDVFFFDGIHPSEVFVGLQAQKHLGQSKFDHYVFDTQHLDSINQNFDLPLCYQAPEIK